MGGGAQKLKGFDMMGWVEGGKEVEGGAGTSLPKSQEAYIIAALNANETFQSAEMKNYLLELYKSMYSEIIEMAKEKKLHMDGRLLGEEKEEVFEGVAQCRMEFGQEIPEPKKSDTWSFKYFPTQEKDPKEKIPPLKVQLSFECCPILPQDMEEHEKTADADGKKMRKSPNHRRMENNRVTNNFRCILRKNRKRNGEVSPRIRGGRGSFRQLNCTRISYMICDTIR